jgi:1,4-alpha-glucan branching enzyme
MTRRAAAPACSFTQVLHAGHEGHIPVLQADAARHQRPAPGRTARREASEGSLQLIKVAKPTRSGEVRVTFALPATEPAGAVSVVGDFNDWDPYAHPLRKRGNGSRSAVVTIPAGATLHFRYLAEGGIWFDDETAETRDAQGATITIPG